MKLCTRRSTGAVLAAACAALATGAMAQSARNADRIVLGAGAAVIPTFEGSNEIRVLPLPAIDVRRGRLFANFADGAGVLLVAGDTLSVGASVALVGGYRRRDVPDGIDRVRFAPGARIFSKLRLGRALITVGGTRALGGTDGIIADATVSYGIPISSRFVLTPAASTSWANRRHMDRYFGVSAAEARASGLPRFDARAGFKNAGASLNGTLLLTDRLSLTGTAGAVRVLNDAADSPLNRRRWNPTGFVGIAYRL